MYLPQEGTACSIQNEGQAPPKINVWAGISCPGATKVVVFSGIMTATYYVDILEAERMFTYMCNERVTSNCQGKRGKQQLDKK